MISINITNKELYTKVVGGFLAEINAVITRQKSTIEAKIAEAVTNAVLISPEVRELSGGLLKYDFGLPSDPTLILCDAIGKSTVVDLKPFRLSGRDIRGGLYIKIQPSDYKNLLTLPESRVITEKGTTLEWLNWLLTLGDNLIVLGYSVRYQAGAGRSRGAVMIPGGVFRVNPNFSGVAGDNFITRSLLTIEDDITKILESIL